MAAILRSDPVEQSRPARSTIARPTGTVATRPSSTSEEGAMALQLGDDAPDFTAETTEGTIHFHEWLGDGWGVLFSHPKDFTPVCTTELGAVAKLKPEFDKRNAKVIAVSVDPLDNHGKWTQDIQDVTGATVNY